MIRAAVDCTLFAAGARLVVLRPRRGRVDHGEAGVPGPYQPRSARLVFVEVGRGRAELWYRTAHADSGDLLCSCGGKT